MVNTLSSVVTHSSKSRISDPEFYSGFDEQHNNLDSEYCRRNYDNNLWLSLKQMVWGKHNPHLSIFRRFSRYRFNLHSTHGWRSIFTRNSDKSSESSAVSRGNRQRNRYYGYYGLLIGLLAIAPVKAETPEETNVSNPVAAATGNVTNQAVMFQNNGAPSRQHYGPNISCNGSTMTFSPFYMGNHTTPFDEDMTQQTYTVAENWGFQVNFMVPLDKESLNRCRAIAKRQEEKMRLDYELVRALKCADLQAKGFMIRPKSRVASMCNDVIPISAYLKSIKPPKQKTKKKFGLF
jgi:hypothetical protein